jgi:hypothetical protein
MLPRHEPHAKPRFNTEPNDTTGNLFGESRATNYRADHGSASSSPAAAHDGVVAGEAINLRNSSAAEGAALLAGTAAS